MGSFNAEQRQLLNPQFATVFQNWVHALVTSGDSVRCFLFLHSLLYLILLLRRQVCLTQWDFQRKVTARVFL